MRVDDLIRKLQKCPQSAIVLVADWNEEYHDPAPLAKVVVSDNKRRVVLQEVA